MEINKSTEMDLEAIRRVAENQMQSSDEFAGEETPVVGEMWMNNVPKGLIPEEIDEPKSEQASIEDNNATEKPILDETQVSNQEAYDGPGIVINNDDIDKDFDVQAPHYTGVTPDTQTNFEKYIDEMDADIGAQKEIAEENKTKQEDTSDDDTEDGEPQMTQDEFNREYNEAVVVIDKTGFGTVIDFTEAEREKLERSKKIKLEEIENIKLETFKTKKKKKGTDINQVIKHVTNMCSANIVLPASGYTAVMKGCSAHELISLIKGGTSVLTDLQSKWSLIYDKIESTSIGKMTYNDFLLNTATIDMNVFIYGILCATYPDDDVIPLNCQKCGKEFRHSYSIRSLIRAEKMGSRLQDLIMNAVDSSYSDETAKEAHDKAPVSNVKRIQLPVSGIIIDLYVQTAYDLINKSAKELTKKDRETKYEEASILSTTISKVFIPDTEEDDGSYYEIEDVMDIVKTIYALTETDNEILTKLANDMLEGLSIEFGLMDITCPACKHYTPSIPMDIEQILFYKYQQAKSTTVE